MSLLDPPTRSLISFGAAVAVGGEALIEERVRGVLAAGTPRLWVDEALLQSVLMTGYPRALAAAAVWRGLAGPAEAVEDAGNWAHWPAWQSRGEATCRVIYGENYQKLRANVARLHPALDAWMVTEGYGRTLGRPGLDLVRREFVVIAQVTVLGAERQLHSHLKGALHAGADPADVGEVLDLALGDAGAAEGSLARRLWERIRP